MVLPFVLLLAFFAVVVSLLASVFAGLLGGIAIAVAATGVMVAVLYAKFARMRTGTVVRFSEYGVELSDKLGFHVRLAWRDITHIGQVNTQMADPSEIDGGGDISVGVGAMKSQGILGWGDRVIPPKAPDWMRENLSAQPRNPADGRPLVAIPLGGIDPNWLNGAMGQWMRQYRPDLLGGYPAAMPQYPAAQPGYPIAQPGYPSAPQPAPGYPQQGGYPPGNPYPRR